MERYREYKESGVKWLGEIPSHWEVKRLGSFFSERKEKVSDQVFAPLSVTKQGIFPQLENVAKTNDGDNRKLVKEGDFVINSRSDRKGSSGVSELDGSVSLINLVLQPRKTIFGPFCNYLLKSYGFIEENYRNGRGIVADLWTTRYNEMKMIKVAMPSLEEQKTISSYLDSATSEIDKAIAMQQKMIDLLNERKQIIIQNAVTKGLDENVEMKESGVEWIGRIPKHWGLIKIKHLAKLQSGSNLTSNDISDIGLYPVYGGNGQRGYYNRYNCEGSYILIGRQGALCGNINYAEGKFWATEHAVVCYPKKGYNTLWLGETLRLMNLGQYSLATAQPGLAVERINGLYLPYPALEEQNGIALFLKNKIDKIDLYAKYCQRQITLLQERKQIIINEVVTGKVRVI